MKIKYYEGGCGPNGYFDGKDIWIFKDLPWYRKAEVLMHELGHWFIFKLFGKGWVDELYEYLYAAVIGCNFKCWGYAYDVLKRRFK